MPELAGDPWWRHRAVYRSLVWLYPRQLRAAHGAEMVQVFDDLVRERGRRVWVRTMIDLAVSLPRTHLEVVMSAPVTRSALGIVLAVAAALGVLAVLVFGPAALPIPIAIAVLAVAQRSRLARAVEPTPSRRSLGAVVALVLSAAVLAGTVASWFVAVDRGYSFPDGVLLVYNVLGIASVLGIVISTILLLRRRPRTGQLRGPVQPSK